MSSLNPLPAVQRFIAAHRVEHDQRVYLPGADITLADAKVIEELRRVGAILLPTELESAENVASRLERAESDAAALRAELDAMKAAAVAAAATSKGKGNGSGKAAPATESSDAATSASDEPTAQ